MCRNCGELWRPVTTLNTRATGRINSGLRNKLFMITLLTLDHKYNAELMKKEYKISKLWLEARDVGELIMWRTGLTYEDPPQRSPINDINSKSNLKNHTVEILS